MATKYQTVEKGICQRGSSYLVHVYHNGTRRTATIPVADGLEAARNARTLLKAEIIQDKKEAIQASDRREWTLGYAMRRTWSIVWKNQAQADMMEQMVERVKSDLGEDTKLRDITIDTIDDWIERLKAKGNKNATINRKLSCLSKCMDTALERGGIDAKPRFTLLPESNGRIRIIEPDEELVDIGYLSKYELRDEEDAYTILIDTGMRTGELLKIKFQDVNSKVVTLWDTKNSTSRSVPLTKRCLAIMERRKKGKNRGDLLFPYNQGWIRVWWRKLRRLKKNQDDLQYVPHCLRHTCASRLMQRGVPIPVVQAWLGHKIIQMTMRYSHLAPNSLLDQVHVLEQKE